MKKGKNPVMAIVLIALLAIAMAAIFIINRYSAAQSHEKYQQALIIEEQKKQDRAAAAEERLHRKEQAETKVSEAIRQYLPGIVFYGDSLTEGVGGNGSSYPAIIRSLLLKNVYDIPVSIVNTQNASANDSPYADYVPVVFIGTNDGWNGNIENLIKEQKLLIAGRERYIVVGIPTGTAKERAELEAAMEEEYGSNYVNLREFFSTNGMASLELSPSASDQEAMSQGRTPPGLMHSDGINLNYDGYKLTAFLVFDRMEQLGYFDEVTSAVQNYENEKKSN